MTVDVSEVACLHNLQFAPSDSRAKDTDGHHIYHVEHAIEAMITLKVALGEPYIVSKPHRCGGRRRHDERHVLVAQTVMTACVYSEPVLVGIPCDRPKFWYDFLGYGIYALMFACMYCFSPSPAGEKNPTSRWHPLAPRGSISSRKAIHLK